LRRIIYNVSQDVNVRVHWGGTYLNMEGPAFSTLAESLTYQSWGMDVIGMTQMNEAKLAREAEICYATMAMVTDYDCWYEEAEESTVNIKMIVENLQKNADTATKIISRVIPQIPDERNCDCVKALEYAIITDKSLVPKDVITRLKPIIGKYIN
jgi:5'-methylthioadenosine phosphorylase